MKNHPQPNFALVRRRPSSRCRGVVSVLAMLYLVLFASLALGFYSVATMSSQVAANERDVAAAQWAAESGMSFIRHHLWKLSIPPDTTEAQLLDEVYYDLSAQLDGTSNLYGTQVGFANSETIAIPVAADLLIALDEHGTGFRAQIQREGKKLRVKVVGVSGSVSTSARAIQLQFDIAEKASRIFDYGLASKGAIETAGSSWIEGQTDPTKGSVLSALATSAYPTIVIGGEGISGDVTYMGTAPTPSISGKVGGQVDSSTIWANHVHSIEESPEFPTVDTSMFETYVQRDYVAGGVGGLYENVRVPPNTNPTFNGGETVRGVLFIERPNSVKFNGNVTIEGTIVVDTGDTAGAGSLATNTVEFSGNGGTKTGVESLPLEPQFAGLRDLKGSFILAPGFDVKLTGNFGAVNGSIVGDHILVDGSSQLIVKGTLINLGEETLLVKGNGEVVVASTGTTNYPSGLRFGDHYFPVPGSYSEVKP